jgi:hypothetical protein
MLAVDTSREETREIADQLLEQRRNIVRVVF